MVKDYIVDALHGFISDPADSDYQRGYLAALLELAEVTGIKLCSHHSSVLKDQVKEKT